MNDTTFGTSSDIDFICFSNRSRPMKSNVSGYMFYDTRYMLYKNDVLPVAIPAIT